MIDQHIWPQEPVRRDGTIVMAAALELQGRERTTLWYSVPEELEVALARSADPFVIGALHLLMRSGGGAHVHGEVSPSLLRNLEDYQSVWSTWKQGLSVVRLQADSEREVAISAPRETAVVAFSGGIDSSFTAHRHTRGYGPRVPYSPTAGVMVHGFDIPLSEPEAFASASARARVMLSSLGLELIPVATNFRALVADWSHSFGAAIASCLMLLSSRFEAGLIGQGLTFGEMCLLHEGSNPLTDPLLSSGTFRVVPDGAAFTRAEKIDSMSDWKEFLEHARVCWEGPERDRNCCVCEKCVRNILTFRALGLGLPPCFHSDVDDAQVKRLGMGAGLLPEIRYGELRDLASARGVEGRWLTLIDRKLAALRRARRHKAVRRIRRIPHHFKRALLHLTPGRMQ